MTDDSTCGARLPGPNVTCRMDSGHDGRLHCGRDAGGVNWAWADTLPSPDPGWAEAWKAGWREGRRQALQEVSDYIASVRYAHRVLDEIEASGEGGPCGT